MPREIAPFPQTVCIKLTFKKGAPLTDTRTILACHEFPFQVSDGWLVLQSEILQRVPPNDLAHGELAEKPILFKPTKNSPQPLYAVLTPDNYLELFQRNWRQAGDKARSFYKLEIYMYFGTHAKSVPTTPTAASVAVTPTPSTAHPWSNMYRLPTGGSTPLALMQPTAVEGSASSMNTPRPSLQTSSPVDFDSHSLDNRTSGESLTPSSHPFEGLAAAPKNQGKLMVPLEVSFLGSTPFMIHVSQDSLLRALNVHPPCAQPSEL